MELLDPSDAEKVVPVVVQLRAAAGTGMALLEHLVNTEVRETVQEATLFRRNSVASRCVSAYAMLIGRGQLKKLLGIPLRHVCKLGKE